MMTWLALKLAAWYIRRAWGPRCDFVDADCPCCKAWLAYDFVFGNRWMKDNVETQDVYIRLHVPTDTRWDRPMGEDGKHIDEETK